MSTQLITERVATRRRAFLQPYRITLLHPHDQGFWWLFVQPPLLAVLVGVVFALFVAPGVIEDLQAEER